MEIKLVFGIADGGKKKHLNVLVMKKLLKYYSSKFFCICPSTVKKTL
jgi:hypothetical protein